MSSISRKTVVWASGAVLAVGGCTAGIVIAAQGSGPASGHTAGGAATSGATAVKQPLRLVSISPGGGVTGINGAEAVRVTYNQPLPASAPLPMLSPVIAGSWQRIGDAAVFTPAVGFPAGTHVTVTVPASETAAGAAGGASGGSGTGANAAGASASASASASGASASADAKGSANAKAKAGAGTGTGTGAAVSAVGAKSVSSTTASSSSTYTTAAYSTLRLQEILAQLGYLPLTWTPDAGTEAPAATAAGQLAAAYLAPAGTFGWQQGYPSQLRSFWSQGQANTMDRGAIMGFEADHNLTVDGAASAKVWKALLTAATADQRNTHGYSYAIASKSLPESLTIWHNGKKVFSSLANTGIGVAPTADGTFPVYEKLPYQVMSGTNPGGSHYADPVEWVSYFNGGDAVHYFSRGTYGWPQSLGCVELPYSAAKNAYPYLPYGTLVTVA